MRVESSCLKKACRQEDHDEKEIERSEIDGSRNRGVKSCNQAKIEGASLAIKHF